MKQELSLNMDKLREFIKLEYGIETKKLTFVPEGEFAYSYILQTDKSHRFLVKFYEKSRLIKTKITTLDFSLDIAYQLNQTANIDQVTYPIKSRKGDFRTKFEDMDLVIWTFVEGKIVNEVQSRSEDFLAQLGELLGKIHTATDLMKLEGGQEFNFDLDFRKELLICIKEATACTDSKDKNYNKLQKLIKSNMNYILPSLVYLEELSEKLKKEKNLELVICHTDPIRHNIIIDNNEKIHLIDWDGAMLAPFEKDIWFYINEKNSIELITSYLDVRKINTLNEDIIIFLFYYRTLEDLTDWIYRIIFEETSKKQIKSDFKGLEEDIWPVLPNMKKIEQSLRKNTQKLLKKIKESI